MHSLFNSQILSEQCIVPLILNLRYYLNNAQSLKFSDIILTMQSPFNSQILSEHCTETFFTALFLGQNYKPILYCSVSDITRRINTLHSNFLYSFIFGQYYKPVSMRLLYILVLHCLVVFPGESLNITHNASFKGFKVSGFAGFSSC